MINLIIRKSKEKQENSHGSFSISVLKLLLGGVSPLPTFRQIARQIFDVIRDI